MPLRTGFSIGGIPVRVDPTFFLLILFIGFNRDLASLATWVIVVFVGVLVHEMGHALVFRAFGQEPRIELIATGGVTWAAGGGPLSATRLLLVSLAGPFAGFVLGALAFALLQVDSGALEIALVRSALRDLVLVSLVWGLLNLVPMLPLDGGRVVQSLLDIVTKGRGERPALVVSVAVGLAAVAGLLLTRRLFGVVIVGFLVYLNVRALARSRPPPSGHDYTSWLDEGYDALGQGARLAASNRAREVLAGASDPDLRARGASLLMWAQLLEGDVDQALDTMAANPAAAGVAVLSEPVKRATGGTDEAVQLLSDAHRARPGDAAAALLARALVETGQLDQALRLALGSDPEAVGPNTYAVVGAGLFRSGRIDDAARVGEASFARHPHPLTAYNLACCRARLGQPAQAMAWMERAAEAGYGDLATFDADADLAVLRDQPGYEELRRRVGSSDQGKPRCYRHPGVAVSLGCPQCQRPICERCAIATSAGWLCPECLEQINRAPRPPLSVATMAVIAVNAAVFVAQQVAPVVTFRYALFRVLVGAGEWFRLLTSTVLHANLVHLLFNSLALWWYGRPVERRLGAGAFLVIYGAAGLAGSAASYAFGNCRGVSLGASGAILGAIGAELAHSWRRRAEDPATVKRLLIWIGVIMVIGFVGPIRTDNLAHLGGLLTGVGIGLAFESRPGRGGSPTLAGFATAAAFAAAAIALVVWRTTTFSCGGFGV
ncbi:MAG: rhomboid family intramembrane serine protease [Actinobacteria bacterium]|nr:rhomboid family intramembrane serine protease [Actinomycetota bacterium]